MDRISGALPGQARSTANHPLVNQAMPADDPPIDSELLAGRNQDQVARGKPADRDLDLDPARGFQPGEPLLLDDIAQQPRGAGKLILIALLPEPQHPVHQGPREKLPGGQRARGDGRVERRQPDLLPAELGRRLAEHLQVRPDQKRRGRRPHRRNDEIAHDRKCHGRVDQAELDRGGHRLVGELRPHRQRRRFEGSQEPLGPGLGRIEADLQGARQRADRGCPHPMDRLDLMGDPLCQRRLLRHRFMAHAEQAGLVTSHLPCGQQAAMAMDRELRLEQVLGDQAHGQRPVVGHRRSPDRVRQPLEQLGHAELPWRIPDLRRGPGPIDPDMLDFLDREDPVEEPGTELRFARAEDLLVAKLEGLAVPAHSDRARPRRRGVRFSVGQHAELGVSGGEEDTEDVRLRDGSSDQARAPACRA